MEIIILIVFEFAGNGELVFVERFGDFANCPTHCSINLYHFPLRYAKMSVTQVPHAFFQHLHFIFKSLKENRQQPTEFKGSSHETQSIKTLHDASRKFFRARRQLDNLRRRELYASLRRIDGVNRTQRRGQVHVAELGEILAFREIFA